MSSIEDSTLNELIQAPVDQTSLHELFEAQVDRTPEGTALVFGDQAWTYRQLDDRANQIAWGLLAKGIEPGHIVALHTRRSFSTIAGLLGVLKAGAGYLPVDPALPAARITYMLEDSGATVMLADHATSRMSSDLDTLVLDDAETWMRHSCSRPSVTVRPGDLAYLIYTSGSTGQPKAVMVPHSAIVNHTVWIVSDVWRGKPLRFLHRMSLSFDASGLEIYGPLTSGGTVVLTPSQTGIDMDELRELVTSGEIDVLGVTPPVLREALAVRALAGTRLRWLMCGGEALEPELVAECAAQVPGIEVANFYGPTETCVNSTYFPARLHQGQGPGPLPIGSPIRGTSVYVVDETLNPVPHGVAGELLIGGAGVTRGYHGRPGLTAELFIPDPFGPPGARLYRTGDLVRRGTAGELEFLGRIDHQVKLRGFRIELGEIEAALAGLDGVTDAVVTAVHHPTDGTRLVGYVTGDADTRVLRDELSARLPDYMVPSMLSSLDKIPLTSSGKLDRAALPEPDQVGFGEGHVSPRDPIEQLLTELFAEVLGVDLARVGVHDDFFALGGHSLLVTRLIARARSVLAVSLAPRDVFEDRTIASLAARIRQARRTAPLQPIRPVDGDGPAPLSPAQERLWFLEQLRPGTTTYTTAVEYRLRGVLDVAALRAALSDVVDRHDALRTIYAPGVERPEQIVLEQVDLPWEFHDLHHRDESAVRALVNAIVREPFDLTAGPLLRARLLGISAEEHLLVLTVHHIAFDGWSFNVLTRELAHYYRARVNRTAPDLPAMSLQHVDFAAWQRDWLSSGPAVEQLGYWRDRLADAPAALNLPVDRPRPAVQSHRGAFEPVLIPTDLVERLRDLGKREGVTLFMTLLTGFKILLARYTAVADIVVGTPIANRNRVELEQMIGFLVNTLALRTDLTGDPTLSELLGRVRETCLGAYANQDVPFEQVVEDLQPPRDLSRSPVVQVMFGFDVAVARVESLHDLSLDFSRLENGFTVCDVVLDLVDDPRGVIGGFTYATDLFDATTIRRMVGHYLTILHSMTQHDPATLRTSRVELLRAADRAEIIAAGTAPETTWPDHVGLHEEFESQVDRTPDAIAVRYAEQAWTYRQLDERANRIAWRLRRQGIGPEHVVALCAQRSPYMVAGVLGILKAGAAYLPIDPALPPARIHYMLDDAASTTVLTDHDTLTQVEGRGQVLLLDDEDTWNPYPSDRPAVSVHHDNLAYLIYTSGSTGLPKAVTMSHRGIHWLVVSLASEIIGDGPPPKSVALNSPIFFDGHVIQFSWMAGGATMVIVPEDVRRDPHLLVDLLIRHEIDLMDCTPSQLDMAAGFDVLGEIPVGTKMLVIGEAVSEKLWRTLGDGPWQAYNLYGPTETHAATMTIIKPDEPLSIGVPLPGYDAFIVDESGELVPQGVAGELVVGGGRLARGYHGRPTFTAERFVPDSFTGRAGRRLYRTGDIVRSTSTGALEFIGRRDNQVKVRGYRIELGEIEAAIMREPGVTACVVMLRDGAAGDKRIVAYFVAPPTTTEAHVLRALERRLPEYMVPSALLRLDSFPMTRNGKVDRSAMPEATSVAAGEGDATPPGDETESLLTGLWSELLDDRSLGVHSHFFKSGGHSLLAIQLIARINKAFTVDLPLQVLFHNPTPHEMAKELRKLANPKSAS
ncbi:amino acid adenylation domain-containing protein [Streptomyces sp. NPDC127117]|uniref:amino acid adenylation domain-containing protein n=1 Tax=Streptomyces sp. NPDC127117 TaxID=3345368 RepID=UPI00363407B8